MSTRHFSSPRLATAVAILGAVAAYGAVAAMGACSAPASGVHVVVTMSDADYDDEHAFDHLTVKARIGARRAIGCLYPADAVERAVMLDGEPRPRACADRRTQQWTGPPTAEGWALETQSPSINVEAAEGEDVEVEVIGGLGGRLETVYGSGTMRASSAFPELRVELRADELLFPEECLAHLEPSSVVGSGERHLCDAELCANAKSGFRSPAVACLDIEGVPVGRVLNDGLTCKDGGPPDGVQLVWSLKGPNEGTQCLRVKTRARFGRCVEGDARDPGCTVTTDCEPPPTWAAVRALDGGPDAWEYRGVECLPPTNVPITWSVELPRPADEVLYGLAQDVTDAGARSCFLDVYAIDTETFDCGAP